MLKKRKWPLKGWHKVGSTEKARHKDTFWLLKKYFKKSICLLKVIYFSVFYRELLERSSCFFLSLGLLPQV